MCALHLWGVQGHAKLVLKVMIIDHYHHRDHYHDDDHYHADDHHDHDHHDHYHSEAECVARCPNKAKPAAEVCTLPLVSGQVVVGDLYDGDDGGDDDDDDVP